MHKPKDDMYFVWAVLSALHLIGVNKHADRLTKYQLYANTLDLRGLTFPMAVSRVATFERNNLTIRLTFMLLPKIK